MLREWRFGVRSAASPNECATTEAPRVPAEVTSAFVDRAPIDWDALVLRAPGPAGRSTLDILRYLESIRSPVAADPAATDIPSWATLIARTACALAAVQTACGLGVIGLAAFGQHHPHVTSQIVLALAFAAGSVLLSVAASTDRRSLFLLTFFACAAGAFARSALTALPPGAYGGVEVIFRGLFPEAFAPAAVWQFAASFPRVRRFTGFDVFARRAAVAAWTIGCVMFAVNLAAAYDLLGPDTISPLLRNDPGHLFWHIFVVGVVSAVVAIFVRAQRAPAHEQRKVARFAIGLMAGTAPFLVSGIARMAMPAVDEWFRAVGTANRLWLDRLIVGGLMATPILSTVAVLADRPFESQTVRWNLRRRWLARAWPAALVAAPFAVSERLIPFVCAATGCLLFLMRSRLRDLVTLDSVDGALDYEQRLAAALERVRLARGQRELDSVLRRELTDGLGAANVRILAARRGGVFLETAAGGSSSLDRNSALVALLREITVPVDLSDRSIRHLLPQRDCKWVLSHAVDLAVPLRHRDGTLAAIVMITRGRDGDRAFDRRDRWFAAALTSAAASAWDDEVDRDAAARVEGEPAFECPRCGWVAAFTPLPCGCRAGAILSALPQRIAGKFVVERRIGAGGMGVVYLARDMTLDRDVALKTLPNLRDGTVARLRDEARAMARLNHEGLATLYGLERWRRTPVLVVEYFPDGTLADRLAGGPLSVGAAITLGIRMAHALAYMHAKGVQHRDLKPSNIGLTPTGAPKLLDFGLATFSWPLAGTPAYLPPEAYLDASPDLAFDLWALSIVLLEAVNGHLPSTGDLPDAYQRVPELTGFFERALALSPELRFHTAMEMGSALADLADEFD